jgi:hypothetical protein
MRGVGFVGPRPRAIRFTQTDGTKQINDRQEYREMRITAEPGTFPITKPATPAGKTAAKLHKDHAAKFARVAEIERERGAAIEAQARADEELSRAYLEAESKNAGKPTKRVKAAESARAEARARVEEPWMERLDAALAAAEEARGAYTLHCSKNLDELLREPELGAAAESARERVYFRARELAEAFTGWRETADAYRELLKLAEGIDGQAIPNMSGAAEELRKALRDFDIDPESLPLPKPTTRALKEREQILAGSGGTVPARL